MVDRCDCILDRDAVVDYIIDYGAILDDKSDRDAVRDHVIDCCIDAGRCFVLDYVIDRILNYIFDCSRHHRYYVFDCALDHDCAIDLDDPGPWHTRAWD